MLGKLLKYEFKAIGRALLPFYGALIVLAAILGIMFRVSDMNQSSGTVSTVIAVIMGILYVVLLCVVVVLTLILVIQRFSRNLLGNEGYLMLTLPTSVDAHIWNKTISATVWTALSGIIGMWVNTYNALPEQAPFGGYKKSGIGRETHKLILENYSQKKNIFIDLSEAPSGFYPFPK